MKIAVIQIAIFLYIGMVGGDSYEIINEVGLNFSVEDDQIYDRNIKMFYALLDTEKNAVNCDFNCDIKFKEQILPLDMYNYYGKRGEEEYFTLLTKTVYSLDQDVLFFSKERLSDIEYLQEIMPSNKISKQGGSFDLKVGFSAPDISFTLNFLQKEELKCQYPELVRYFKSYDKIAVDPEITVFQHNHTFGKVLGQKTSKMSISITRYYGTGNSQTLAINYSLSFIHNLPPSIFGGGNLIINQMKEGVIALVRDTREVCERDL